MLFLKEPGMSNGSDFAVSYFNNGFNCSQSVLISHCEEFGMDKENALKISCGFGGGMAHTDEVCGAVTGALMLIGLKYGKYKAEDNAAKEKTYELVKKFTEQFKLKYGSVKCTDLINYDLSKNEELEKARAAGVFKSVCPALVKESVEIVESILKI